MMDCIGKVPGLLLGSTPGIDNQAKPRGRDIIGPKRMEVRRSSQLLLLIAPVVLADSRRGHRGPTAQEVRCFMGAHSICTSTD